MNQPTEEYSTEELEQLGEAMPDPNDDMEDHRPDEEEESPSPDKEEAPVDEKKPPKEEKKVNLGALHEERARRKESESRAKTFEERNTLLEQRLNILLQRMTAEEAPEQKPPEDPAPDLETDPYGYIKWQQRQIDKITQTQQQSQQQSQQQQQIQQIISQGTSQAMEFRSQAPEEYDAAINFLIDSRSRQLEALGKSPAERQQIINTEMTRGMLQAMQSGQNPGEYMMKYAKGSGFVFNKKSTDPIKDLSQKIAKNQTLGNSPKHGSGDTLTASDIADMTDEEFEKFYTKSGKKGLAKVFNS